MASGVAPDMTDLGRALTRRGGKTSVVIAVDLANYIISSNLAEGTVLPNEKEMADELGVGRASIREALRLLETRGILQIRSGPRGGPVVRQPLPSDFSSAMELALQFERATLAEVIRAREDLGPLTAKLAAERADGQQIARLRDVLAQLNTDLGDSANVARQARRFEALLGEASGSTVVRIVVDALNAILWDTIPHLDYSLKRNKTIATNLAEILESVEHRDGEAAREEMNSYVRSGARYWRRFFPDLFAKQIRWTG
jgi:GntR family transcriptional regulator, transcriptional repressor for pyruvate dehydrogenase complex